MTKKDKGKPEPPIVLRDVLAGKPELFVHGADLTVTARAGEMAGGAMRLFIRARRQAGGRRAKGG